MRFNAVWNAFREGAYDAYRVAGPRPSTSNVVPKELKEGVCRASALATPALARLSTNYVADLSDGREARTNDEPGVNGQ